ncbi:hypothetical protein GLOIN_2v1785122 [Rhizophagus irregularis DAOM 181602=DAOM 197198]|nr:hypothetical protein GLOIN_2v1785122 [Rhizophagus irregularis DAOM 181602=DAOM 197198]
MDSISTKQLLTKTRKKLPSLIIDEGACLLLPDEFNGYIQLLMEIINFV